MNAPETRTLPLDDAELRADFLPGGQPVIRGVAIRYGSLSLPLLDTRKREFREKFRPGAFSRALATGADVRALVNHDPSLILGRNKAGTLRLLDEPDALRYEIDPPSSELAKHYVEAVKRGDITGVSFRFYKLKDSWTGPEEARTREVIEADLDDISLVTYPAYPDTEAAARSLDEFQRVHQSQASSRWLKAARMRLRLASAD